jgi:site-specific DNA-methyltransferase (adenine-specific)/modification methylase
MERPVVREHAASLVIEGDCLDVMKHIPDGSVNLVLCDLPYGTTQNSWDSVIPLDKLWEAYQRILAPKGAVVLMGQGPFTAHLILSRIQDFKYKIVWIKSKATNFLNAKKQPLRRHEDICVFYSSQPTYNPVMSNGDAYNKGVRKDQLTGSYGDFKPVEVKSSGSRYPSDVHYCKTAESEGSVWHSTQKPVELGRYLIRTYSNPGDVVLDNASGSGSFLVAGAIEDRRVIGIEINHAIQAFKMEPVDLIEVTDQRLAPYIDQSRRTVLRSGDWGHNSITTALQNFLLN